MSMKSKAKITGKAREKDTMTQATRIQGSRLLAALCLLALCLFASATLSGRLISTQSPAGTPGSDLVLRATDHGATDDRPADHSQDRQSQGKQQPATVGESEDSPDKKINSGVPVIFAPFELSAGGARSEPEPAAADSSKDASPPQLLQRPPPAG